MIKAKEKIETEDRSCMLKTVCSLGRMAKNDLKKW